MKFKGLDTAYSEVSSAPPNTRWFKYDRDWFVQTYTQISPGHIWTTLYIRGFHSGYTRTLPSNHL